MGHAGATGVERRAAGEGHAQHVVGRRGARERTDRGRQGTPPPPQIGCAGDQAEGIACCYIHEECKVSSAL
eukprot:310090-Pleurochrysis_carterae.AAC.3